LNVQKEREEKKRKKEKKGADGIQSTDVWIKKNCRLTDCAMQAWLQVSDIKISIQRSS
jgi:hypothetical protein